MVNFKLTYFDVKALGEPIRFILAAAGVQYEDNRVVVADWGELKAKSGYGQLPILNIDGEQITQSLAIMTYLANKFDLQPAEPLLAARCYEIASMLDEIRIKFRELAGCLIQNKPEEADKAEAVRVELKEAYFPKYFKIFDDLIGKTSGTYIAGDKLSWCDLALASWVNLYEDTCFNGNGAEFINAYPNLKKLYNAVFAVPAIKNHVAARPVTVV